MLRPPDLAGQGTTMIPYRTNLAVGHILQELNIPTNVVGVVLVDGQLVTDLNSLVSDGGTVELYPVFGGG
ncbi:ubiquitin family protein [Dethiobacter alkaliphilus]|uniref:hypothetical protein n=1 Tax=Dethiobacter alkaliphilus TaxID=427926 RepID=UPI0022272D1E|nr:hypothetical protein [Dethiobacter alkaliphilus]MCW3489009.1 hypothetical protein [Dethiobacter alkaliphilus]